MPVTAVGPSPAIGPASSRGRIHIFPNAPESTHPQFLRHGWEKHSHIAAAIRPAPSSPRAWWSADSLPTPAADASAHMHAAAAIPNQLLQTRLDPPRHPDHRRCCRPPPGPMSPASLVDADSELGRALSVDPFHLDWPHW